LPELWKDWMDIIDDIFHGVTGENGTEWHSWQ
jgi:hypothetical protein